MNPTRRFQFVPVMIAALFLVAGCSERDTAELAPASGNQDPLVYGDAYGDDVYFQPFFETHYTAASHDSVFAYNGFAGDGARSLKMNIPPEGSALGAYSGGVLTSGGARDLSVFNALTFYARTDSGSVKTILLNEVGYGNDNTGNSLYGAGRANLPLTGDWTFQVVPIPAPSKLLSERGLFMFAEGLELWTPGDYESGHPYPDGYNLWFDEIKYAQLDNIEVFRPQMDPVNSQYFVPAEVPISGTKTIFRVDGAGVIVDHSAYYFDYESDNPAVATVTGATIAVVDTGTAVISGMLEDIPVVGTTTVSGYYPPTETAPPPTLPAENVISMFSDVYQNIFVETWTTFWGQRPDVLVQDYAVNGDNTKMYTSLSYTGIVFESDMVDASALTHFHLDTYAPVGTDFKVELVSFPGGTTPSVLTEVLVMDATTVPAFESGTWSSLEIPLADFVPRTGFDWTHIGQIVISTSDAKLVLVDNMYWHN